MNSAMRDEYLFLVVLFASALVSGAFGALIISHESETKSVNQTFLVVCRDEAGRPVKWRGPNGPLGPKSRPFVQVTSYGTTIVFNETKVNDTGTYACSSGNQQKFFNLTVAGPLMFMDTNSEQEGKLGQNVFLRCEVKSGNTAWSIEGGGDISDKTKFEELGDGLLIKNLQLSDAKTYTCAAFQESTGEQKERKVKLTVLHPPMHPHRNYAEQKIVWGYVNGRVNLTCIMPATPPANFEWSKISDPSKKIGNIISESKDVSILQLYVQNSTFGNYKCNGTNKYGSLAQFFELQRGSKPHPPRSIELRGANSNLLNLGISGPDRNETETRQEMEHYGYQVQFKTRTDKHWASREFNISEVDTYSLDELKHDTEYEVRAATRNLAGLSEFTNSSIFKTLTSQADGVHFTLPSVFGVCVNVILLLIMSFNRNVW